MKSTPTAAMDVLLNLTLLGLLIMAEARMALYRLHIYLSNQLILNQKQGCYPSGKVWVTPFWTCGRTTLFQFITTPKPSRSSYTRIIGELKTQCSLRML
jgi:hypothetical protein